MRTHLLIFVALALFSLALPITAIALTADGGYCETSSTCQSGYCQHFDAFSGICQSSSGTTVVNNTGNGQSAGTNYTSPGVQLINPLQSGSSLESFLGSILDFVIRIGSVVVILMMVFVGFKFVTAQGNESKVTEAKGMLLWTVIGALVLLGAKAIQVAITATVQSLGG